MERNFYSEKGSTTKTIYDAVTKAVIGKRVLYLTYTQENADIILQEAKNLSKSIKGRRCYKDKICFSYTKGIFKVKTVPF